MLLIFNQWRILTWSSAAILDTPGYLVLDDMLLSWSYASDGVLTIFFKGACSNPQPHISPNFFKHNGDFGWVIFKKTLYMCEVAYIKSVQFQEISEKQSCKLENMVITFYKTISNKHF